VKVIFKQSFAKDLKQIRERPLLQRVQEAIVEMEGANTLDEVRHIKKIQGSTGYYRMRLGDYRLGMRVDGEAIVLVRFLHRKEIYRYFP
jgi:mRNA interferase RelE/StbE